MITRPRTALSWWRAPLADLQRELETEGGGLTDEQAAQRLKRYGQNSFRKDRARPLVLEFLSRFRNPLVLILLAASAVSAVTGETASFVIVLLLVLLSVTLDFVQERRAAGHRPAPCRARRLCSLRRLRCAGAAAAPAFKLT